VKFLTKALNQAVKRNIDRFPSDFMFRLSEDEWEGMRSQFVTAYQSKRNTAVTPYAFTEHGVTMLASVLKSEKAVKMNIFIVRAFIALRQFALQYKDLADEIGEIKATVADHGDQLSRIYAAIETLMAEKATHKTWEERERIGFRATGGEPGPAITLPPSDAA
jgi:phage regulator Rha-like protein